jgi:hypothetical protein
MMPGFTNQTPIVRPERRVRLLAAAADFDFAAPRCTELRRECGKSGKSLQTPT